MVPCLFVSDLHGGAERYEKLWRAIETETPRVVFLGGDLLPSGFLGLAAPGGHAASEDRRISIEGVLPQAMAQHDHASPVDVLFRHEATP